MVEQEEEIEISEGIINCNFNAKTTPTATKVVSSCLDDKQSHEKIIHRQMRDQQLHILSGTNRPIY